MTTDSRLAKVDRKMILFNAVHMTSKYRKRCVPLWAIVRDICSVGSHSAHEICREMGWNPDQPASWKLVEQ